MVPPITPASSSHFCHLPSSPVGAGASGFSSSSSGISKPQVPRSLLQVKVLSAFLIHLVFLEPSGSDPSSQVRLQVSTAHSIVPPMTPASSSHFCHLPSSPVGAGASGFSSSGLSSPSSGLSSSSGFSPSGFSPSGPSSSSSSITIPQFPRSLLQVKVLSAFLIPLVLA